MNLRALAHSVEIHSGGCAQALVVASIPLQHSLCRRFRGMKMAHVPPAYVDDLHLEWCLLRCCDGKIDALSKWIGIGVDGQFRDSEFVGALCSYEPASSM